MRNFDEDKRICDAATAGPWSFSYDDADDIHYLSNKRFPLCISVDSVVDARFIAEAREGWPAALAEIERLRSVISSLRCDECGDELGDTWCRVDGEVLCEFCGEE